MLFAVHVTCIEQPFSSTAMMVMVTINDADASPMNACRPQESLGARWKLRDGLRLSRLLGWPCCAQNFLNASVGMSRPLPRVGDGRDCAERSRQNGKTVSILFDACAQQDQLPITPWILPC